ncbi:ribonuclease Z [Planctomycetes bacterium Poly30]|uniref:Ribonuclease Z n=1 Tax=Saltatorellus ferox TaxID=2528018 RepID=A0A518ENR8_9BACT|nr:ribonuclease Z [Planctomycetes bacterium Poly30]
MHLRLLPSAFHRIPATDGLPPSQPLTSFILRSDLGPGPLAVDAGSLGMVGEAEDMARIRDVLLTHAHIDHIATLPMWLEALLSKDRAPIPVHATKETIEALRAHFFNDVIFPNFEELKEEDGRPLMQFRMVSPEEPCEIAGFEVLGFRVDHPVPTTGYWISDGEDAVVFASDSGPTERLWEVVRDQPNVRAVVLETSFPDWMEHIARPSGHLTPMLLGEELRKVPDGVRVLITHMKPAYRGEIIRCVEALRDPRVELLEPGSEVTIGGVTPSSGPPSLPAHPPEPLPVDPSRPR